MPAILVVRLSRSLAPDFLLTPVSPSLWLSSVILESSTSTSGLEVLCLTPGGIVRDFSKGHFETYIKEPWRYVEHFGWPDRFQLNQDLFAKLEAEIEDKSHSDKGLLEHRDSQNLIEDAVRRGLEGILPLYKK